MSNEVYLNLDGTITAKSFVVDTTLNDVYISPEGIIYSSSFIHSDMWGFQGGVVYASKFIGNTSDSYAIYSEDDNSLTFYRSSLPIEIGSIYRGKKVTSLYTGFENSSTSSHNWSEYKNQIKSISFYDTISPINTSNWFSDMAYVENIDVSNLDTSKVSDMSSMFSNVGRFTTAKPFEIIGLEKWNVSNVLDMQEMFYNFGSGATDVIISGLEDWDVSNVTNMMLFMCGAAYGSATFDISNLQKWDVSNVTNMSRMFDGIGHTATEWSLDLRGWNVAKVEYHSDFNKGVENKVLAPTWVK